MARFGFMASEMSFENVDDDDGSGELKMWINKSNFIFIPVLEKLGSVDFVYQKNKKWWP